MSFHNVMKFFCLFFFITALMIALAVIVFLDTSYIERAIAAVGAGIIFAILSLVSAVATIIDAINKNCERGEFKGDIFSHDASDTD